MRPPAARRRCLSAIAAAPVPQSGGPFSTNWTAETDAWTAYAAALAADPQAEAAFADGPAVPPSTPLSAFTSAGTNFVRAHPVLGSILSALDGKHSVTAGLGGETLQSATSISMACPPGGLNLPAGGVSAGALASGAASSNVGALSGDLAGNLPSPTVTGLHVDFSQYPAATSDRAAAAVGVPVGGLYRDTGVAAGKSYLAVRMS